MPTEHIFYKRKAERGQTMVLVAISLVSLLAMAALAIDVVTLYAARGQLERAADAAALAAAKVLADSGVTTDPSNAANGGNHWQTACTLAALQANNVATQNLVAGQTPTVLSVTFPNATNTTDCSGAASTSFGINPQVTVQLQVTGLPTFFSRIWSKASPTVNASSTAEAYNPSGVNASGGTTAPVAPRCVKPILLPNCDPNSTGGSGCGIAGYKKFFDQGTGSIASPGSIIGEVFQLQPNCGGTSSTCSMQAPAITSGTPPILEYYPLTIPTTFGIWLCSGSCSALSSGFEQDLGCCNMTPLQCGQWNLVPSPAVPSTQNPENNALAQTAGQCLIHEWAQSYQPNCSATLDQDCLDTAVGPPYIMKAGTQNPLIGNTTGSTLASGDPITTSDSVVSLPVYDSSGGAAPASSPNAVSIIGYLQVFIDDVASDTPGTITVTVLNVAGCGNNPGAGVIQGAGTAVPVRLIQAP
jgi:Flp pilus assembly protein TadG